MEVQGNEARITVINAGTAPSPATTVRVSRRPPLATAVAGQAIYPRHHFLRDERGLVIWPEFHPDHVLLRVRWHGRTEHDTFAGRVQFARASGVPLEPLSRDGRGDWDTAALKADEEGWISWTAVAGASEAGFDLRYAASPAPATLMVEGLALCGVPSLMDTYIGNWWLTRYLRDAGAVGEDEGAEAAVGRVIVPLDDVRLVATALPPAPGAMVRDLPVPPLDPGGRAIVSTPLGADGGRLFAVADPDDRIIELLEGNNAAHWKPPGSPTMLALHTHASFSEGNASVDAQMDLLTRSGYDAVFWTEHDWRILGYGAPDLFGFEEEPAPDTWSMVGKHLDAGMSASAAPTGERFREGRRSLRLEARRRGRGSPPARASFAFRAYRAHHIRPLAQELSLALDVFPDLDNPFDSELVIDLQLSDQPHVRRWLTYRIEALSHAPALGQVVLPAPRTGTPARIAVRPGQWTRVVIPVSQHARLMFPEGVDNNLSGLELGLEVWDGTARWDVDALKMETGISGLPLLALQEQWTRAYPALASHVTQEVSFFIPHFNAFTSEPFLLDYTKITGRNYISAALEQTRARDGALSVNHPMGFGQPYPLRTIEEQIQHRLYGADLLEVGYRYRGGTDLAAHLAFWDRALAAGIAATGVGVTDAHGAGRGNGFYSDENNFATWVDADPDQVDGLIDALLGGALTFGDPLLFEGRLTLEVDGLHGPGAVVVGERRLHQARLGASGIPPGSTLELVVDGQVIATTVAGVDGQATAEHSLDAGTGWVRLQSWDPRGAPLAFTNAILFLDQPPPEGMAAARLHGTGAGLRLRGEGRYRIHSLSTAPGRLEVGGTRGEGALMVEGAGGPPAAASILGSEAPLTWDYDAAADRLRLPLAGPGLAVTWRSGAIGGGDTAALLRRWWLPATALLMVAALLVLGARRRRRRW